MIQRLACGALELLVAKIYEASVGSGGALFWIDNDYMPFFRSSGRRLNPSYSVAVIYRRYQKFMTKFGKYYTLLPNMKRH